jgi:hypothetical protein
MTRKPLAKGWQETLIRRTDNAINKRNNTLIISK